MILYKESICGDKKMTEAEEVKLKLEALSKALQSIEQFDKNEFNIFSAVGMQTQEVKHSFFLAYLLDAKQSHGFGDTFLRAFLSRLYSYKNKANKDDINRNMRLLANIGIRNADDFDLFTVGATVVTEKVLVDQENRIDIFIETVRGGIIIENKTITTNHDDQLARYVEQSVKYDKSKKYIYVYLTPKGDLPAAAETPESEAKQSLYCLFDYKEVIGIVKEFRQSKGISKKLVYLLEDYEKMVRKNILRENEDINRLCAKILREHAEALAYVNSYHDNADDVVAYCVEQLGAIENMHQVKTTPTLFEAVTDSMNEFFIKRHENIDAENMCKCRISLSSAKGDISVGVSLQKFSTENWSAAQTELMRKLCPNKTAGDRYFSFEKFVILSYSERSESFDNVNVKSKVDNAIKKFIAWYKTVFEMILKS